jgi:uncharacterized protein (DUF4415 family)
MSTKNRKIKYGKVDMIPDDAFEPRNVKERVTMFVDQDVVNEFRKWANKMPGGKYQTLMNQALRRFVFGPEETEFEKKLNALNQGLLKKAK